MPSIRSLLTGLCAIAPLASAAPARIVARESASAAAPAASPAASAAAAAPAAAAPAAAGALSDVDILQLYVDSSTYHVWPNANNT